MNKITADHLSRRAFVYIRQSTPDQVRHSLESQRLQYALVDRARVLGWRDVDVIDEDLGISGAGARRPGFERMLRALLQRTNRRGLRRRGLAARAQRPRLTRAAGVLPRRRRVADRYGNRLRPQAHQRSVVVGRKGHCVCAPRAEGGDRETERFGATTPELERMAAWLKARGVESVALESTGVYWIAPHEVLERHGLEAPLQ